jgi:2-polyprenyl-3-methyl-5-hydroxy-6-metoxy-1,4-benzoquinol methylase
MLEYTEVNNCRVCKSENLTEVLDLNKQPLANSYHKGEDQKSYPLKICTCNDCFHTQLSVVVNPDLMFRDYLYVSGTSKTLHQYFSDFVGLCEEYTKKKGKVLDIACNDGTQLDKFKEQGWETFGVDPAENLYPLSKDNHNVLCEYWNPEVALSFQTKFDLITAQNVFAHVDDVHDFLQACVVSLNDDGYVIIQTSQADMILDSQFDTIYHEHLSFFSSLSMKMCANINGFSLVDVRKTEVHGGSYVFVLQLGDRDESLADKQIQNENNRGLYNSETYKQYANNCLSVVNDFRNVVEKFKSDGYKVVGYGAAAKGNTFLNFAEIDLDYIVDDNELKWDLMTPGRNIEIKNPTSLVSEDKDKLVVVPLAWNFFREISNRANEITNSSLKFIKYFPKVEVI